MAISAGTVAAFLTLDTGQFEGAMKQSRTLMDTLAASGVSTTDKMKALGSSMDDIGKAMSLTMTTTAVAAGTAATKAYATFDDAIREVQATMSASADETEKLSAAAQKYGAATRYSAVEAAQALNYLAAAGYDTEKAIGALPTVLRLAQAGGLDLAYASDLVTDSMSALGLEMGQLSSFSDQLAKTAQATNSNISQLGYGILTVGGTAKSLAGGTVELNAMLGILADNGIKGAEGGTHLRNVLLSLQTPTEDGAALLSKYTNGVYDAEGSMRSLDAVLQELNASMDSMTDAERQSIISGIFNKTDLAAVEALLSGCGDRFAELSAEIALSQGAAQEMADTMEGGIGGSFRSLESAVEAVAITFGETLAPNVQSVAEWLTNAAQGFAELDAGTRSNIVTVAAWAAAAGPAVLLLGKTMTTLAAIGSVVTTIGPALIGPVGLIALAAAGVAALNMAFDRTNDSLKDVQETLAETNAKGIEKFRKGAESLNAEVAVDVSVKKDYSAEASTLYSDIYTWLTDGMPDTEQQKKDVAEKVQAYYDELLSEVDLKESTEQAKLQEQLDNGFITYETFNSRTAKVLADSAAARTNIGALCDESLAFVQNYAGKPAAVVQEAYTEIDSLQQRTDELLKQIGLANVSLSERGENAVALTKAGATGDTGTYGLAFEYTSQQFAIDKEQIEADAANAIAEAERIWSDAYSAAEQSGDQAGMDLANQRYDELLKQAEAERAEKLTALEAAYVGDFGEMFAGIGKRFPEQAQKLLDALKQTELADQATELLRQDVIRPEDISGELKAAMAGGGIDFDTIIAAAAGDEFRLQNDLRTALNAVLKSNNIDIGEIMTEGLAGTELGDAFAGMLQAGYLDGLTSLDMTTLDAQLALITGHVGDTISTGVDGEAAAGAWMTDISSAMTDQAADVSRAASRVGSAGKEGLSDGGMNYATGKQMAGRAGDGLVDGLQAQRTRVKLASKAVANAAISAMNDAFEIRSPSRKMRRMANMVGDGFVLGLEDRLDLVRSTMRKITDTSGMGSVQRTEAAGTATAAEAGVAGGGTTYNISVQGARINNLDEAKELLAMATKYTNSLNRGRGR